jgi:hypothetical protein
MENAVSVPNKLYTKGGTPYRKIIFQIKHRQET